MQKSGNLSESEVELDSAANTVTLTQPISSRGNIASEKSAVRLLKEKRRAKQQKNFERKKKLTEKKAAEKEDVNKSEKEQGTGYRAEVGEEPDESTIFNKEKVTKSSSRPSKEYIIETKLTNIQVLEFCDGTFDCFSSPTMMSMSQIARLPVDTVVMSQSNRIINAQVIDLHNGQVNTYHLSSSHC